MTVSVDPPSRPRRPYLFRRPLLLLLLSAGVGRSVLSWRGGSTPSPDSPATAVGRPVTLEGRVDGPVRGDPPQLALSLQVDRMRDGGVWRSSRGTVRVSLRGAGPRPHPGDRIRVWGPLRRPAEAALPGGFSARRYWARQGVDAQLAGPASALDILARPGRLSPTRWIDALRRSALEVFHRRLGPERGGILAGLVLGARPTAQESLAQDFRRSGLYHLLVASGSNVAFVLMIAWALGRWMLGLPSRPLAWALIPTAFFYAALAGGDPPVQRAAWMAGLLIAGRALGREDRTEHALGLSAALLLLARPSSLADPGFQMSYAATWGLITGLRRPPADEAFEPRPQRWENLRRAGRALGGILLTSLCAQAALAPLLFGHFQRFSWAGFVTNAAGVPLAGAGVGLGAALFAADRCPGLGGAPAAGIAQMTDGVLRLLIAIARAGARLPHAEIQRALAPVALFFLSLGAVGLILFLRRRWGPPVFGAVMLASIALGGVRPDPTPRALWPANGGRVMILTGPGGETTVLGTGSTYLARQIADWAHREGRRIDRLLAERGAPPGWIDALRPRTVVDAREAIAPSPGWSFRLLTPPAKGKPSGTAILCASQNLSVLWVAPLSPLQARRLARIGGGMPIDVLTWPVGADRPSREVLVRALRPRWVVAGRGRRQAAAIPDGPLPRWTTEEGPLELRAGTAGPILRATRLETDKITP